MAKEARGMVKDSIDSFVNLNTEQAEKVLDRDDIVDKLNKTIFKFLVAKMQLDPSLIEPASQMIVLSRNLERLADHATNIAEELVFYVKAEIIAHSKKHEKYKTEEGN
jgi:phosphate transport system protein